MCWHASPLFEKKKKKTVCNNVFLLKSGSETSEPLRVVCVIGKGAHAQGAWRDTVTHNHFSTLNFSSKKVLQPHSPQSQKLQFKFLTWKVIHPLIAKKPVCFCLPTYFQMKISDRRPSCFSSSKINYIMSRSEGC